MEINLTNISAIYKKGTPFAKEALYHINLTIPSKKITGIIGKSGSGKSTLAQVITGLMKPTTGQVKIDEYSWYNSSKDEKKNLRKSIGFVFQFPEHQLFSETVEKDISYGLKKFDFEKEKIEEYVKQALELVGLPYEVYAKKSPFTLSGGEMKRVAIASVIAYKPKIIIFDEPTVGLDSNGKRDILSLIKKLNKEENATIIIVSHFMDEVAGIANHVVVLDNGEKVMEGKPSDIFGQEEKLQAINLDQPQITKMIKLMNKKLDPPISLDCFSIDELEKILIERLGKRQEK